ncbi:MAG: carbohydrate ABC transporter permease [Proteobacteria bacterium]|nr:carbohydrate ABC transporter permease [Pseudomonadota bacterium]
MNSVAVASHAPNRGRDVPRTSTVFEPSRLVGIVGAYIGLGFALFVVGIPTYWVVIGALKTNREIYTVPSTWWPPNPAWTNFPAAWAAAPFPRMYLNSIAVTVTSTTLKLVNAVTVLPNYLTVASLGYVNSITGLILPTIGSAFGTFFLRQHFLSLPREVIEAARVDGAGHLQILWHVVLPLSRPVLATLILLTAVARWNDFLWPLVVTSKDTMRTLPVGIFFLFTQEGTTEWGVVLAGTIIVIAPIIALFIVVQRHLVEGIASGAVKG